MNDSARVTLYLSMLKERNCKALLQHIHLLEISRIVPLRTSRSVHSGLFTEELRNTRKEKADISVDIGEMLSFSDALVDVAHEDLKVLLARVGDPFESLVASHEQRQSLSLFIEPEAGWSDEEISLARENGLDVIKFGKLSYDLTLVERLNHHIRSLFS